MKMTEAQLIIGIESFYRFIGEGKLMAAKCNKCSELMLPPRPICIKCYDNDLRWLELKGSGKLLTYTIIHVAPKQFETSAPYVVGIVKLDEGPCLLGIIKGVEPDKLKVGMNLTIWFEKASSTPITQWPKWTRYYFKPL
jgi:uncharacterized OB-fold protein